MTKANSRKKLTLTAKRSVAARYGAQRGGGPVSVECFYCGHAGTITWFAPGTCNWYGQIKPGEFVHATLEFDHFDAVVRGGSNEGDNLVLACWTCNGSKSGRTLDEWLTLLAAKGRSRHPRRDLILARFGAPADEPTHPGINVTVFRLPASWEDMEYLGLDPFTGEPTEADD